ncbi:MAG: DUF5615 family PIN-like protein [Thermomicrobiales bacterium]
MATSSMLLLVDENVPDSVSNFLRSRGHDVRLVRDLFPRGIPDPVIAARGNEFSAIVVTVDKDFESIVRRIPEGNRNRFRNLGRISLRCSEVRAKKRVEELIESIEFEFVQAQRRRDQRLIIEITETSFRVVR